MVSFIHRKDGEQEWATFLASYFSARRDALPTAIRLRDFRRNSRPPYLKLGALTPDSGKYECNFQRSGLSAASFKGIRPQRGQLQGDPASARPASRGTEFLNRMAGTLSLPSVLFGIHRFARVLKPHLNGISSC